MSTNLSGLLTGLARPGKVDRDLVAFDQAETSRAHSPEVATVLNARHDSFDHYLQRVNRPQRQVEPRDSASVRGKPDLQRKPETGEEANPAAGKDSPVLSRLGDPDPDPCSDKCGRPPDGLRQEPAGPEKDMAGDLAATELMLGAAIIQTEQLPVVASGSEGVESGGALVPGAAGAVFPGLTTAFQPTAEGETDVPTGDVVADGDLPLGVETTSDASSPFDQIELISPLDARAIPGQRAISDKPQVPAPSDGVEDLEGGEKAVEPEVADMLHWVTQRGVEEWTGQDSIFDGSEEPARQREDQMGAEFRIENRSSDHGAVPWSRELFSTETASGVLRETSVATAGEQIGRELVSRAETFGRSDRTEFSMRLDPPELGTVRVHLSATDKSLSARFVVDNEAVRQIIAGQMDSLRQSLAEAGMTLQRFDISHGGQGGTGQEAYHREAWQQPLSQPPAWRAARPNASRWNDHATPRGRVDVIV